MAVCARKAAEDVPRSRSLEILWRRMPLECRGGDKSRSVRRRKTEQVHRISILQRPQEMVVAESCVLRNISPYTGAYAQYTEKMLINVPYLSPHNGAVIISSLEPMILRISDKTACKLLHLVISGYGP